MTSKSFRAFSIEEATSWIKDSMTGDFKPTLAIVFCHVHLDILKLHQSLVSIGIPFIGANSAGEFIEGDIENPSIAVMLLDIDPSAFKIYSSADGEEDIYKAATQLGKFSMDCFKQPALVVLASGLPDGEKLVDHIEKGAGTFLPVFGGLASENLTFEGTYVISDVAVTRNGIVALVIDTEQISVEGLIYGGWRPIGIKRTITKSKGNVVYEIDHEPALKLIARYSRIPLDQLNQSKNLVENLTTHFQLQLYRENTYPVVRAAITGNIDDLSLFFTGEMPEGGMIQFSLAPSFEVIDNVIEEYGKMKEQYSDPDAVLLFSCKARQMVLGPWIADEIQRIRSIWETPLSGFLTYGEIGKTNAASTEFHNMACSLLLLKEK
jgi:hypothetical protein